MFKETGGNAISGVAFGLCFCFAPLALMSFIAAVAGRASLGNFLSALLFGSISVVLFKVGQRIRAQRLRQDRGS